MNGWIRVSEPALGPSLARISVLTMVHQPFCGDRGGSHTLGLRFEQSLPPLRLVGQPADCDLHANKSYLWLLSANLLGILRYSGDDEYWWFSFGAHCSVVWLALCIVGESTMTSM